MKKLNNGTETCQAGVCTAGTALTCADANPCTTDTCDPVAGCQHGVAPDGTPRSDGNLCNGVEVCHAGVCQPGTPVSCADNNPCTTETCDPKAGCLRTAVANGTPCVDSNLCNGEETCQSGVCTPGTPPTCSGSEIDACDPITGCTQDIMIAAHKARPPDELLDGPHEAVAPRNDRAGRGGCGGGGGRADGALALYPGA